MTQNAKDNNSSQSGKPIGLNRERIFKQNKRTMTTTSMKRVWVCSLLCLASMLPILIEHQRIGPAAEAGIVKKVLKGAKKYAWILAPQRQKFYAIPLPFPLPVFVRRQHIYTQVPVIPRYVQRPYEGSSSDYGSASSDDYASMSSPGPDIYSPSSSSSSSSASSSSSPASSTHMTRTPSKMSRHKNPMTKSGGYLAQFASAVGYNYNPSSVGTRDLVTKLLSGQAKVLSPAALLSNLKPTTSSAMFDENYQGTKNSDGGHEGGKGSSSSGDASSSSGSTKNNTESSASMKPSASEMFYSSHRHPSRVHPYMSSQTMPMGAYRYTHPSHYRTHPMMMPSYSPYTSSSALAARGLRYAPPFGGEYAASQGQFPIELMHMQTLAEPQSLGAEGDDVMDAHAAATSGQLALSAKHQSEQHRPASTPAASAAAAAAGQESEEKEEHDQLDSLRKQAEQEHLMEAVQRIRFKAALVAARERQLAETNAAALTAHQMGLPLAPSQLRLINY